MKVVRAEKMGFCFGVQRAYDMVEQIYQDADGDFDKDTVLMGDLVHNEDVVERVEEMGIDKNDYEEDPEAKRVITRTHGEQKEVYEKLVEGGNEVVNLICPIVTKVRIRGNQLLEDGAEYVVLIGKKSHPEVLGNKSWIDRCEVVQTEDDIAELPEAETIGVVSQTTFHPGTVEELTEKLKDHFPEVLTADTICPHTSLNQQTSRDIAPDCDMMLVVGGPHSSNSKTLYKKVKEINSNTHFIQDAGDLPELDIEPDMKVGLTAGASTPDWIVDEIEETLYEEYGEQEKEKVG